MPYIKTEDRLKLDDLIDELANELSCDKNGIEGNLNYTFTRLIDDHLKNNLNYKNLNAMVGVLECCKQELYRRIAGPYEDTKVEENGDAYETKPLSKGY